jgi:hypothetical protein
MDKVRTITGHVGNERVTRLIPGETSVFIGKATVVYETQYFLRGMLSFVKHFAKPHLHRNILLSATLKIPGAPMSHQYLVDRCIRQSVPLNALAQLPTVVSGPH